MTSRKVAGAVRDPWLPMVYTGIWMMIAGAVCLFALSQKRKEDNV